MVPATADLHDLPLARSGPAPNYAGVSDHDIDRPRWLHRASRLVRIQGATERCLEQETNQQLLTANRDQPAVLPPLRYTAAAQVAGIYDHHHLDSGLRDWGKYRDL